MKDNKFLVKKDFLETYSNHLQNRHKKYKRAIRLRKKNVTTKNISKKLKISRYSIYEWFSKSRGSKPIVTKSIEKVKKRDYLSIKINSENAEHLAYLVGYSMGDGNISRDHVRCWFYGHPKDLKRINLDMIKNFGVEGTIYTYKPNNAKMAVHDTVFTRLLIACKAPVGDKTDTNLSIPYWIKNSETAGILKVKFLQGLFDSELSKIQKIDCKKFAFQSLTFYTVKTDKFVESGFAYLNEIRSILSEFNISTSKPCKDRTYVRTRDDNKMTQIYFIIHSNHINLYIFLNKIGFLYNHKRKNSGLKFFKDIKKSALKEMDKIKKYPKVISLRKKGLSAYKISKEVNLPAYNIKAWCYRNMKPILMRD